MKYSKSWTQALQEVRSHNQETEVPEGLSKEGAAEFMAAASAAKKAGKTGLAVLSGIAFGALLYAFGEFLQSETFANLTDYLIGPDGLLKRLASFDISFGEGVALLGTLLGGLALAFAAGPLNLLFKPLNAAVTGIKAGIGGLTSRLGSAGRQISGRPASGAAPAAAAPAAERPSHFRAMARSTPHSQWLGKVNAVLSPMLAPETGPSKDAMPEIDIALALSSVVASHVDRSAFFVGSAV